MGQSLFLNQITFYINFVVSIIIERSTDQIRFRILMINLGWQYRWNNPHCHNGGRFSIRTLILCSQRKLRHNIVVTF